MNVQIFIFRYPNLCIVISLLCYYLIIPVSISFSYDDRTLYEIMNEPAPSKNITFIDEHGNKISYLDGSVYYKYNKVNWGWEIENGKNQPNDQNGAYAKSIIDIIEGEGNQTCENKAFPDTNQNITYNQALDNIVSLNSTEVDKLLSDYFKLISKYKETETTKIVETSLNYVKDIFPPIYWAQNEPDILKEDSLINLFMDTCTQKATIETSSDMLTMMYFRTACTTYNVVNAMGVQDQVLCEKIFKHAYEKLYESMQ